MLTDTQPANRVALVGTGHRGTGMWGQDLLARLGGEVDLVGLCDLNTLRAHRSQRAIGTNAPVFQDFGEMLRSTRPDTVMVCTRDDTHDALVVQALEAGSDVITEKPMATTAEKCRRILEAEARTGRKVHVAFNYRHAPFAAKLKELLLSGVIGELTSVDFHWYLDTRHGADYFRRWHAYAENSGSLFVHKATHHFDLLNWYIADDPEEVFANGSLRHYGRNGPFRGERCRGCEHAGECNFYLDISADPWLEMLYEDPSREDGYVRDACVFREDIDIYDTMSVAMRYRNGVQVAYSLNACMPMEGHHLAFNGRRGRIEMRHHEKFPFGVPEQDEILVMPNFGKAERILIPREKGGHFGGDRRLQAMLFDPSMPDPLHQRAGARAGAMSVLCGVASLESARTGRAVPVAEQLEQSAALVAAD
ncbi:Gfo/Idh/MocA family oxidoreductase [Roseomonas sp. E05]|uniref:Gfo/Idh/MocA family oxidoreductase n=1 Tax=Roseomonas sp. E05 TaxID=3046310 RepID=UPI0024BA7052|nr:Gfo/Idh/MocA family oxidoreductase [Roseomonas sp. E05]MDJ0388852.1 Gfo/Idh/MocA family oxidoreductase [Roseomonas sp. E05]